MTENERTASEQKIAELKAEPPVGEHKKGLIILAIILAVSGIMIGGGTWYRVIREANCVNSNNFGARAQAAQANTKAHKAFADAFVRAINKQESPTQAMADVKSYDAVLSHSQEVLNKNPLSHC